MWGSGRCVVFHVLKEPFRGDFPKQQQVYLLTLGEFAYNKLARLTPPLPPFFTSLLLPLLDHLSLHNFLLSPSSSPSTLSVFFYFISFVSFFHSFATNLYLRPFHHSFFSHQNPMAHINFSTKEAASGWKTQARETLTYWVPEVDIKGTLPKDLIGTFFRNGTIFTSISVTPQYIHLVSIIHVHTSAHYSVFSPLVSTTDTH